MPFVPITPIFRNPRRGGSATPYTSTGTPTKGTSSPARNVGRTAAPVQQVAAATDSVLLISDQKSLSSTKLTQGNVVILPQSDIIEIDHNMSLTITGTVSVANDVANTIDHIEIYDGNSGQLKVQIPGGTYLYDHLVRFYPVRGAYTSAASAPANTIGTSATSATAVLRIPVRIPQTNQAPCKMTTYYATIATAAGSATSVAVTNNIYAKFGSCEGKWMRVAYQVSNLASGLNFLNQLAIPSNVLVSELFFRTGTLTSITWVQVFTNGTAVMPYQEEAMIAARDASDFGLALQSTTLCLNLGTQFGVNSTSYLQVNTGGAISNEQFVWVWFE